MAVPRLAFLSNGDLNTKGEFKGLKSSCMLVDEPESSREGGFQQEQEIRKYEPLFKLKVNPENLPAILDELLKG
jgi:hypothetical protein